MLKGIDPVVGPELLRILAAMGHGDVVVLCDANFPAAAISRQTVTGSLVRLDGVSVPRALTAILSLFPLDLDDGPSLVRMAPADHGDRLPKVQIEAQAAVDAAEGRHVAMGSLERHAFYDAARKAFAVVLAGDGRAYGCFLLRKGVIFFDDQHA